ncbi:MAG: hypothetical protein F9K16_06170 [Thermoanaerobaculia bacterium]|nr:MAG: hypothetical protein F9K16_06170 [Thermoanaerobaculia bacterium]MBZ0102292.1 hypothetical protein [Thermoanaerobaculia bacterium]
MAICSVALASEEPFAAEYQKYLDLPDVKAFAVAVEDSGAWVAGYSWGAQSINDAEARALTECASQAARELLIAADCAVIAVGNARTGEPHLPAATDVAYEVRWVNGTSFVIGATEELQLWAAFTTGRDPQAFLYLVNGGGAPITFSPERIRATVGSQGRKGPSRSTVRVFSAAEYEKKVRTKQAWKAALHGAAVGLANQPRVQTSTFQGDFDSHQPLRPENYTYGSFAGQITRWPSAAVYAAASQRSAAQIHAMDSQLQASFQAIAASLLRTHTLMPGSYYGGIVHVARFRGQKLLLEVPFGDKVFRVYFTMP